MRSTIIFLSFLALILSSHIVNGQTAGSKTIYFSVQGTFEGKTIMLNRGGGTEIRIICSCSNDECYSVETEVVSVASSSTELDCSANRIYELVENGKPVTIRVDNTSYTGNLKNVSSSFDPSALLLRQHKIFLE